MVVTKILLIFRDSGAAQPLNSFPLVILAQPGTIFGCASIMLAVGPWGISF
ncbi:MAG: hypothetical protein ACH346_01340 [Chthoniobacterales bacterium]